MNHAEVNASGAVERYLLREMDEADALRFEEHFFECPVCADDIRGSTIFLDNLRAVLREPQQMKPRWRMWTMPASIAAGLLLAFSAGYQGARIAAPAAISLAPAIQVGAVRSGAATELSKNARVASVVIRHEWQEEYSGYVAELQNGSGRAIQSAKLPSTPGDLSLVFQTAALKPGSYTVVLFGAKPGNSALTPLSRFPIKLTQ